MTDPAGGMPAEPEGNMVWIRVDDDLLRSPAFVGLPDDTDRMAFLTVASEGAHSDPAGYFQDRAQLERRVPGWVVPTLDALVAAGLIHEWPDGRLSVTGRFYPRDPTGADRQRRHRDMSRDCHVTTHAGAGRASSSSSSSSSPRVDVAPAPAWDGLDDDWYRVCRLAEELTGRPYAIANPWSKMGEDIRDAIRRHGVDAVVDAWRRVAGATPTQPTVRQLVFGSTDILDAIPKMTAEDREKAEFARVTARMMGRHTDG